VTITVRNAQRKLRIATDELQEFGERALQLVLQERASRQSVLSALEHIDVILISDRRMADLHKQFMGISGPTDVLTFQHGEIFISPQTAQRQARDFRTSMLGELKLYLVHGLLHLHGLDDTSASAAAEMQAVQARIFAAAKAG
jgi:probable rRNA maturation factor